MNLFKALLKKSKSQSNCQINLLSAIFIVLFVVSLTFIIKKPVYWFIDDIRMREIVSGELSGTPDGHAIYIAYIWGAFLSFLYKIFPQISWYDVSSMGISIVAIFMILYRSFMCCETIRKKVICGIAFSCIYFFFFIKMLVYVQFTFVSVIAFITAFFWYISIRDKNDNIQNKIDIIVILIFFALSIIYRKETFLMLCPFLGISIFFHVYKNRINWKREVTIFGSLILTFLIISFGNHLAMQMDGYKEYQEYNMARSSVYDHYGLPEFNENYEFYEENGISANLYEGMDEYALALLGEDISTDLLENISDYQEERLKTNLSQVFLYIKNGIKEVVLNDGYSKSISIITISAILFGIISSISNKQWKKFLTYCYVSGGVFLEIVFFSYRNRLLEHLYTPLILILFMTFWNEFLYELKSEQKLEQAIAIYLGFLALTLIPTCLNGFVKLEKRVEKHRQEVAYSKELADNNPENFYYVDSWDYCGQIDLNLFNESKNFDRRNYLTDAGWIYGHPVYLEALKNNNLETMGQDLLKKNVFFISPRNESYIIKYYSEKGKDVKVNKVEQRAIPDETIYLYKIEAY